MRAGMCLLRYITTTILVSYVVAFSITSLAWGQVKDGGNDVQKVDHLVEAMASRNKEPKIITTKLNDEVPVFADSYDWPEQERVWQAMQTLIKTKSDEIWWQLIKHCDDNRYAITSDNDEFVDMTATNFSVGSICSHIAETDLGRPYLRHLQEEEGRILPEGAFHPQDIFWKHKDKWAGKPLYLIQISVCQRAIEQMVSAKGICSAYGGESPARTFTAKEKAKFTEEVKKEIKELERTKKANTTADIRLPGLGNRKFDPKRAKTASELYEKYGKKP
jgi:hypothetical protein